MHKLRRLFGKRVHTRANASSSTSTTFNDDADTPNTSVLRSPLSTSLSSSSATMTLSDSRNDGALVGSSASSSTSGTVPMVPPMLASMSLSGSSLATDDLTDYSTDKYDERFVPISASRMHDVVPPVLINLPHIRCVGVCKGHDKVFKAQYLHANGMTTPVVLKVEELCSPRTDSSLRKHSRHEAAILSSLNHAAYEHIPGHAYIIRLYDHFTFETENRHVLMYEYCQYGSLFTVKHYYGRYITLQERMQWAADFTQGLAYMHDMEIAHRDFKLLNIALCWSVEQNRIVAKLIDFGFSGSYTSSMYESASCGSLDHIAPELLVRRPHHPIHADLWAYAVTLYCLFENTFPFPAYFNNHLLPLEPSCAYFPPEVMKSVPSFNALLASYFVQDGAARPSIRKTYSDSQFFREFERRPLQCPDLFALIEQRRSIEPKLNR